MPDTHRTPYILIETDHGWRGYAECSLADLNTSKSLLCREGRVLSWGSLSRTLDPSTSGLLTSWTTKKQAYFTVTLADSDDHFTGLMRHEPLLGKLLYLYIGYLSEADTNHKNLFTGKIVSVRRSGPDFIIQAAEDSLDPLSAVYYLPRAGQFANAKDGNARLPIVYGDMSGASGPVWELPCIDTTSHVYAYAGHSCVTGPQEVVYLNGFAALPEYSYLDENCSSLADWTDLSSGTGSPTVTVVSGKFAFQCFTNGDSAWIEQATGATFATALEVTISTKHLNLDAANGNIFELRVYLSATCALFVRFRDTGLFVHNGSAYVEAGTDLVTDATWQEFRFVIDFSTEASATCDVYLDGELAASAVDCSYTGSGWTAGQIDLYRAFTTATGVEQTSYVNSILIESANAAQPYVFNPSNSSYGDIATVAFTNDLSEYVIAAKGRGADDTDGDLITDPIEIIDDLLTNRVAWTGSWNATAKATAQQVVASQGYEAAGVIQEDRSIYSTIQQIAGSFLGAHFLDGENKLVVQLDDGSDNWRWTDRIPAGETEVLEAEQVMDDIVNELPVQYAPNWSSGEFSGYDSGSTSADTASQGLYGERRPDEPFELPWVRSSAVAATVQETAITRLKKPHWRIRFVDYGPINSDVGLNDTVLCTLEGLYDESGQEMVNQICRVIGLSYSLNADRTEYEVLGTRAYLTFEQTLNGVFANNSPVGTPGADLLFDGTWSFGGDRNTGVI